MCTARRLAAALATVAALAAGCRDAEAPPQKAPAPQAPYEASAGDTLVYTATDPFGEAPGTEAREHVVSVLRAMLAATGEPRARVEFTAPAELQVTVAKGAGDAASVLVESEMEFRFRVRAPSDVENKEREQRDTLGDYYRPAANFAWLPLEIGGDILVYVPEAPTIARLEALENAEPRDEAAIERALADLRTTLLREVFSGADLSGAEAVHTIDGSSVRVTIRPERREAFHEFTQHYLNAPLAVIVDGVVIAAPPITEPLSDGAEIRKPGTGFTHDDADALAARLQRVAWGVHLVRRK